MPCVNHPGILEDLIVCWRCRRSFCHNCAVELQSFFFCPDCKPLQVRDILAGTDLVTPDYASNGKRLVAWIVDGVVKAIVSIGIAAVLQITIVVIMQNRSPEAAMFANIIGQLLIQVCEVLYEGLMLSKANGQTVGKMLVGIRVVTPEGNRISAAQAWWRAGFRSILNFSTCTCGPLAWLLDGAFVFGAERTTLHDLVERTRVVNVN